MPRSRAHLVLLVSAVVVVASCGVRAGDAPAASTVRGTGGEEVAERADGTPAPDPAGDEPSDRTPGDDTSSDGAGSDAADDDETSGSEDDQTSADRPSDDGSADRDPDDGATADDRPGSGPQRYGDDAAFDLLQDDCEAGDDRACDVLYLTSPADSGYEAIGETCGGRTPLADRYCAPETVLTDDGLSAPDNSGLAVLRRDCLSGDLTACDLLYQISPVGSDEEETGHTCGGAVPRGAYPSCRSHFAERTV